MSDELTIYRSEIDGRGCASRSSDRLLAAPPVAGELHEALNALAAKAWRHPFTGLEIRFGCSTLERWYYAAKRAADPVQALRNQVRGDIGRFPSLSAEAVQALTTQYREHPGWTAQLHYDNLRVTLAAVGMKCPSYPSVRRYLKAQGLLRQRPLRRVSEGALAARDRLEQREVRSYEVEHVLQLMHLDFHHGSRKVLTRRGEYVKPLLVGFIDDRSRFLCHAQWYTSEGTRGVRPRAVPGIAEGGTAALADDRSRLGDDLRGVHRGSASLGYFASAHVTVLATRQGIRCIVHLRGGLECRLAWMRLFYRVIWLGGDT